MTGEVTAGGLDDVVVSGLLLDGNRSNQSGGTAVININGSDTLLLEIYIDRVYVRNSYQHGIFIHGDNTTNRYKKIVSNCYVLNHGSVSVVGYGIYVDYARNTSILHNTIKTATAMTLSKWATKVRFAP
jgi:hypothetical protein